MISIKFLTHSIQLENLSYVLSKKELTPRRRYQYLRYAIFGLSINGSYATFSSGYVAHLVFPTKIIAKYSIKPVVYVNYDIAKTMIPAKDRSVYYYHSKLAFEMELVSESAIPLHEAEKVYISTHIIKDDLTVKLERFCREHGIPVEYGIPVDQETKEIASRLLKGDRKTIEEYNRTVCQYFNIDCRVPSEQELKELLIYWRGW